MDFLHALISGILAALAFWIIDRAGLLDGRSRGQKFLILMPVLFVVILVFNLIWPGPA